MTFYPFVYYLLMFYIFSCICESRKHEEYWDPEFFIYACRCRNVHRETDAECATSKKTSYEYTFLQIDCAVTIHVPHPGAPLLRVPSTTRRTLFTYTDTACPLFLLHYLYAIEFVHCKYTLKSFDPRFIFPHI